MVAGRLREDGRRVLLVEAGPRLPRGARAPEVDRRAWAFRAIGGSFDWYRTRAVGGRALQWGGWAHRVPEHVLARAGFPFSAGQAARHYRALERWMGVVEGTVDARYVEAARALEVRVSGKCGAIVGGRPFVPRAPGTRTNLVALSFEHARRAAGALACLDLATGRAKRLSARAFVLAASPIETARILLASDLPGETSIGRGLVDHLVASYLLLEPRKRPLPEGRGPFPGMALVHDVVNVSPETTRDYRGGFSIELSGPVSPEALGVERMIVGDPDGWSVTSIHALGETFAHTERRVSLDAGRTDALGRVPPLVHVAFSDEEARLADDMKRACIAFADALAAPGSRVVPFVDPLAQLGAGHEAGTCRASDDPDAPCDRRGRLRALGNVFVADASAVPTPTDRHPTLTALVHALRVGDEVARRLEVA